MESFLNGKFFGWGVFWVGSFLGREFFEWRVFWEFFG